MKSIIVEMSKYMFVFLIAFYTYAAFMGAAAKKTSTRKIIYHSQSSNIFLLHFFGYLIMYLQDGNLDYVVLYVAQVLLFVLIIFVYSNLYPKASRLLINNMCMLMAVGFIMLGRLDYDKCFKQYVIAAGGTVISLFIPWLLKKVKSFRDFGWLYCTVGIVLLFLVLLGNKIFGANLVLTLGPISVQPAEFVKILYVMFIAAMFNKSTSFKTTAVTTVMAAIHVIILVLSNDLGAALIFFVVYLMMMYTATKKPQYMVAGLFTGCAAATIAYQLFSHVRTRVQVWLDPWTCIDDKGYQIAQSLFSIGMGSWFGVGLFQGMPYKIPVAEKDFMFSAITEEFGIIFAACIILICLNCLILMMNIASMCKTLFYRLVAVGLAVTYGFQVFLTIGGAMKFIPLTGVTLPFVSYGGSSMLSSLVLFALINGMYIMRQDESEANETDRYGKTEKAAKKSGKSKTVNKDREK